MTSKTQPKLKDIVIIGKFDDGKCRQLLILPETQDAVLSSIMACEKKIKVLKEELDGIEIQTKEQAKILSSGDKT